MACFFVRNSRLRTKGYRHFGLTEITGLLRPEAELSISSAIEVVVKEDPSALRLLEILLYEDVGSRNTPTKDDRESRRLIAPGSPALLSIL
jgi:hypothetical protein